MFEISKSKSAGRGERHSAAWGKRLGSVFLLLIAGAGFAQGQQSKFAHDLQGAVERAHQGTAGNETVEVIVRYKQTPGSEQETRVQHVGARLHQRLGVVKGIAMTIPVSALPALEADPEIASVHVDHPMRSLDDTTDVATGVSAAWTAGYNGAGVTVAVIDSGINDTHPDLLNSAETKSRVVYRQDFTGTSNTNSSGGKYDLYGHGTHVAGIIGGNGYLSGGNYSGTAPGVSLVDLRALDLNGNGTDSSVIAAIQEAITLKSTYNVRVINLSLGRGIFESYTQDPLCQAVESAWKAGIVVVVAAGNYGRLSIDGSNGYGTVTAPGNDPYVITVGATKSNGSTSTSAETLASYSSKGPTTYDHVVKPDLVAPGNDVVSLAAPGATLEAEYPAEYVTGSDGKNDYFSMSGTSMATPVVSGAAALLLQQNSNLTPDQVKARLMKTAYKGLPSSTVAYVPHLAQNFTSTYDMFAVGAGLLNMQSAISNTNLAPATLGAALSPTAQVSSTGSVSLTYGNSSVAASSVVWGNAASGALFATSVVWGGTQVSGSSVVWGSAVAWNDALLSAFSVVWGGSLTEGALSVVWGGAAVSTDAAFSDAGDDEQ